MKTQFMNFKRHISLLLALCLIVALVPAGVATEADAVVFPTEIRLNRGNSETDLDLMLDLTSATFEGGCGFEVATANGNTNVRQLVAKSDHIMIQAASGYGTAVLKVKVPAGTYRVFMKTPNVTKNPNAGKLKFIAGGKIGANPWDYTGDIELGTYDFNADGALNNMHMFDTLVTLPETDDNIHQIAIRHDHPDKDWVWGVIESFIFVPVGEDLTGRFIDGVTTTAGQRVECYKGPMPASDVYNYIKNLNYGEEGLVYSSSAFLNVYKIIEETTWIQFFAPDDPNVGGTSSVSYNILVPQDGKYNITLNSPANDPAGHSSLYRCIADVSIGGKSVGNYNGRSENSKVFYAVELSAGVNEIKFTCAGKADNSEGYYLAISNIVFSRIPELTVSEASISVAGNTAANGSLTITADGAAFSGTATAVISDNDVAAFTNVAVVGDKINYTVKGKKAGTADATVTVTDADGNVFTDKVSVTVSAANQNVFGTTAAYFEKTSGETYVLTMLAGIESVEYSEVGFYVTVGDGEKQKLDTTKVYQTVTVTGGEGATVTGETFGLTADDYVYICSTDNMPVANKGVVIKFQPYAIPVDGEEIVGSVYVTVAE